MSSKATEAGASAPPPPYDQAMAPPVAPPVTMAQPGGVVYQYVAPTQISPDEAPDHMVMAILATICCCLPLGVVAIVKASGERFGAAGERFGASGERCLD